MGSTRLILVIVIGVIAILLGTGIRPDSDHAEALGQVIEISAGDEHTCVRNSAATVECWGRNHRGQLGDGTYAERTAPVEVCATRATAPCRTLTFNTLTGVTQVSAGGRHTCALTFEGEVKCWGDNDWGQLGIRPWVSVRNCQVEPDRLECSVDASTPLDVVEGRDSFALLNNVAHLSAGGHHTCVVTTAGGVKCWGRNTEGQLGDGQSCGTDYCPAPVDVAGLTSGVIEVSAGDRHSCVLTTANAVKCWGLNSYGQLGNGTFDGPDSCGTAACSTTPVSVCAGGVPHPCTSLLGSPDFAVHIAWAGGDHTCAVVSSVPADDAVTQCWGRNDEGQLGDGTATHRAAPVDVCADELCEEPLCRHLADCLVSPGPLHTCSWAGLCWGNNSDGQLGDGTLVGSNKPVPVVGCPPDGTCSKHIGIFAGGRHTCSGTDERGVRGVRCWGDNTFGQLGDGKACGLTCTEPVDVLGIPLAIRTVITISIRWCIMEGSPQAQGRSGPGYVDLYADPVNIPPPKPDDYKTVSGKNLIALLDQASYEIFLPQAHVALRAASAPEGIPIIDDYPDYGYEPGQLDTGLGGTFRSATSECEKAWSTLYPEQRGIILVNAKKFEMLGVGGAAPPPPLGLKVNRTRGDDLCGHPRNLDVVSDVVPVQKAAVYDPAEFGKPWGQLPPVVVLAHEIGHTLLLGHGNGLDDNIGLPENEGGLEPPAPGPRRYDGNCDPLGVHPFSNKFRSLMPVEDGNYGDCAVVSLMIYGNCASTSGKSVSPMNFQPLQVEQIREVAKLTPGALAHHSLGVDDPAGWIVAEGPVCAPCVNVGNLLYKSVVGTTPGSNVLTLSQEFSLPLGLTSNTTHITVLDVDSDESTGCSPSTLGVDIPFQGAEFVTQVGVQLSDDHRRAIPTVWKCESSGTFEAVIDPRIAAFAYNQGVEHHHPDVPSAGIVGVQLPLEILGGNPIDLRLQAIYLDEGSEPDRLPADGSGALISLLPPPLPECSLDEPTQRPGSSTPLTASLLPADRLVEAYVGGRLAGTVRTNGSGEVSFDLAVPSITTPGLQPVTLLVQDAAVTANCILLVEGTPVTPVTTATVNPDANAAGWHNSNATVTFTAVPRADGPPVEKVTYSATGAVSIAPTDVSASPASISIAEEGTTTITFYATDEAGTTEPAQTLTIRVDKTAPVISITGVSSGNDYDNSVVPAVSFTDSLSGLGLSSASLDGDPFVSGTLVTERGPHTLSAEAIDLAGNVASISVPFTIYWTTSLSMSGAVVQYSDSSRVQGILTDYYKNPLVGSTLQFNVDDGGETICSGTVATDVLGIAAFTCGPISAPAGAYQIDVLYEQDNTNFYRAMVGSSILTVTTEDARIGYENSAAKPVEEPGGTADFSLAAEVRETNPEPEGGALAAPGDISLAELNVALVPVGPGSTLSGTCVNAGISGTGYESILAVNCSFIDVPVNVYSVVLTVDGDYYHGSAEDVLFVYDPSLGFTTGGGFLYWPGTNDPEAGYRGDRTSFGYTMKYNRSGTKIQGSLLLIRHHADGTIDRIKSNALYGLALGTFAPADETYGWASFAGKSTYKAPQWAEPEGNYEFSVYVEDRNEAGTGVDRFWIKVWDGDRIPVLSLSLSELAAVHAVPISGGNIVVPH